MLLGTAREVAGLLGDALKAAGAQQVAVVGAARRGVGVVPGLSLLATGLGPASAAAALKTLGGELPLRSVRTAAGEATAILEGQGPLRIRCVSPKQWVGALLRETADRGHLASLGRAARARNTTLGAVLRGAPDEDAAYRALGLRPVPPELREGADPSWPDDLLPDGGLEGVFHVHTDWSDGTATIVAMAHAAAEQGFTYVGISDHSRAASYARGLDGARLAEQAYAVAAARREMPSIGILHGIEVDILDDGTLDLDDDTLAALDFVIASVHTRVGMPEAAMTPRVVRAVSHPLVTMLGHPTGRVLRSRGGSRFDVAAVAKAAAANDTYLEINANPHRLDLREEHVRVGLDEGACFVINPDAHATRAFADTGLGVSVARRAGVARGQVLNALDEHAVRNVLAKRKAKALRRLGRKSSASH